jgi:spore germination protein YaaH
MADKNIRRVLDYFKPSSVWLGIPAYGYVWCDSRARTISSKHGIRESSRCQSNRDPSGALFFKKGKSCIVYLSDWKTRSSLTDLARRFNLEGTALWRLGSKINFSLQNYDNIYKN